MPYIGNTAADRFVASKAATQFSGDGSTTAFTLEHSVGSDEDILVSVDGVVQEPSVAYAVSSGTTLTFTAAPSSNSGNNIFVYYLFRTVATVDHPATSSLQATDATFTGAVTANAGVSVDNITIDGTEIDLSSGDLTIDVAGSIILDSGGDGQIEFADTGTTFGILYDTSNDFGIYSAVQDKDIKFQGNDGGSVITALTLNMSDGGTAQFNEKIQCSSINTGSSTGTLTIFGGGTNKGGTIELSGGNNTGSTGSGIVFKTGASTSSPSEKMRIDQTGAVTKPLQPAFMATKDGSQDNIAINSVVTTTFNGERFDQNGDFASNTFTAPVTGKYQINLVTTLANLDQDSQYIEVKLVTSNKTYTHPVVDPDGFDQDLPFFTITVAYLVDMDANDTCTTGFFIPNGSAQTDIRSGQTFFSGYLVA